LGCPFIWLWQLVINGFLPPLAIFPHKKNSMLLVLGTNLYAMLIQYKWTTAEPHTFSIPPSAAGYSMARSQEHCQSYNTIFQYSIYFLHLLCINKCIFHSLSHCCPKDYSSSIYLLHCKQYNMSHQLAGKFWQVQWYGYILQNLTDILICQ